MTETYVNTISQIIIDRALPLWQLVPMEQEIAKAIIAKFGGAYKLAAAIGMHHSAVYKWTYPKERGGNLINRETQLRILEAAEANGVKVKPSDFFPK